MSHQFRSPAYSQLPVQATAFAFIISSLWLPLAGAFSPANQIKNFLHTPSVQFPSLPKQQSPISLLHQSKIIDAEVIPDDEASDDYSTPSIQSFNLVEYSQNQDPDWKSMPVAFCDTDSNTYIDCNLAFYAKDPLGDDAGGAEYALGVPCEIPIVVALELDDEENAKNDQRGEEGDGTVVNLSKVIPINPDDNSEGSIMREEDKEEIFQMAARALMDEFGPTIRLKKTPRVLTMEGDLDAVIGDWKEILLGSMSSNKDKFSFEDALKMFDDDEDEDDDEDFFDTVMKRDLGPDYMKLVEDDDDDEMDEALLKLFDSEALDGELSDLLDDVNTKENNIKNSSYDELVQQLQPSAALKLLNFLGPGGKEYTILRPLRPILLVGKEDPDDYTRRILLSEEERIEILPRLESACREELEVAGFFLASSANES
eukprot:CAMPEP_0183755208 /NCGR_PEP_ID=MMETSP0739-20130205/4039_1 /TAXON_ID=385413 /ORGANISM="Thalassiosira miniscula, Strain CCMP1093" /LENGTH=427 /DNA_ID=CAMNT_0025991973 /DNA_START=169 /DNA_END=1452 /DNA_ORIENTATION=+